MPFNILNSRSLRPWTIIGISAGLLFLLYVRPLTLYFSIKSKARTMPGLWIVPKPLGVVPAEYSGGRKLSYFGYEFEVPWTEMKSEKKSKSMGAVYFSNGPIVMFFDPAQEVDQLKTMTTDGGQNEAALKNIFGKESLRSNYALRSAILHMTPDNLRLFSSRQEMVAASVLLMIKPIWTNDLKGGIYSFRTKWLRGFQLGDPSRDKTVEIDGFDAQDRELRVVVGVENGHSYVLTQWDLDQVINSLRDDPPSQIQ